MKKRYIQPEIEVEVYAPAYFLDSSAPTSGGMGTEGDRGNAKGTGSIWDAWENDKENDE